jgi:MoaA/NifB/PqqE/SkfB family radical SAM enzyme
MKPEQHRWVVVAKNKSIAPSKSWGFMPWNQIPQLINGMRYRMRTETADLCELLDYDPIKLTVFANRRYTLYANNLYARTIGNTRQLFDTLKTRDMDLETFRFALEQVPSVRIVEFSGRGESLLNPELFAIIRHIRENSAAEVILNTNGLLIVKLKDSILSNPPDELVVRIFGHKPSSYYTLSGLDARHFIQVRDNVSRLARMKKERAVNMRLVLVMFVDYHHVDSIPDMIEMAEKLGVDELRLENYETPDGSINPDLSLFDDDKDVVAYLAELEALLTKRPGLKVILPRLFKRNLGSRGKCHAPFQHVGIDGDCNVTPCLKHRIDLEAEPLKVWEADFWDSNVYRELRNVHGSVPTMSLPEACRTCPLNQ